MRVSRSLRFAVCCFALLVVGAWLRGRIPRPTSEGDKWLWEQAETIPTLEVTLLDAGQRQWPHLPLRQGENLLRVRERAGIRNLLRAWQIAADSDTSQPLASAHRMTTLLNKDDGSFVCLANLRLVRSDGDWWLTLYREGNRWGVWRRNDNACAPLRARRLPAIGATLREATDKAQDHRVGYIFLVTSGAASHIE